MNNCSFQSAAAATEDDQAGVHRAHGELHAAEPVQTDGYGGPGLIQHRQDGIQRRDGYALCKKI